MTYNVAIYPISISEKFLRSHIPAADCSQCSHSELWYVACSYVWSQPACEASLKKQALVKLSPHIMCNNRYKQCNCIRHTAFMGTKVFTVQRCRDVVAVPNTGYANIKLLKLHGM